MIDRNFVFGMIVGVLAGYALRHYQASKAQG